MELIINIQETCLVITLIMWGVVALTKSFEDSGSVISSNTKAAQVIIPSIAFAVFIVMTLIRIWS